MPKKPSLLAQYQSRSAKAKDLPTQFQDPDFLVPAIARDMGNLSGAPAENTLEGGDAGKLEDLQRETYQTLADTTATLLDLMGVADIPDEVQKSVEHRLAANVDPLVSIHSRVDHLYRSYRQGEDEHVVEDAEKLWATLVFRAPAVVGMTLEQLLS